MKLDKAVQVKKEEKRKRQNELIHKKTSCEIVNIPGDNRHGKINNNIIISRFPEDDKPRLSKYIQKINLVGRLLISSPTKWKHATSNQQLEELRCQIHEKRGWVPKSSPILNLHVDVPVNLGCVTFVLLWVICPSICRQQVISPQTMVIMTSLVSMHNTTRIRR